MTHLSPDEIVDAVEDVLDARRRAHLDACEPCRRAVADLTAVLHETRDVEVPEPGDVFWRQLAARVRSMVAEEPVPGERWPAWLAWPVLAPLAALALLALVLTGPFTSPAQDAGSPPSALAVAEPGAAARVDDDAPWRMVVDVVGDDVEQAGLSLTPGTVDRAADDLSADERAELVRLLRSAVGRQGS